MREIVLLVKADVIVIDKNYNRTKEQYIIRVDTYKDLYKNDNSLQAVIIEFLEDKIDLNCSFLIDIVNIDCKKGEEC